MAATAQVQQDESVSTKFAKDQLKSIIERIEKLEEEKKATSDDIRDVYAKALRTIVRMRKMDVDERREQQDVLDTYLHALGMLQ